MSLRPPDPTTNHLTKKDEATRMRRAALIPVGVGLAVVLVLAGISAFHQAGEMRIRPFSAGDLSLSASDPGDEPQSDSIGFSQQLMSMDNSLDSLMILRPEDSTLSNEPSNLPEHPQGRRLTGLHRTSGHLSEEIAFWKVDMPNPAQALTHYLNAASEQNFVAVPRKTPPASAEAGVISHVLMRKPSGKESKEAQPLPVANDLLTLRARATADGQVMITIWYRYAEVPSHTIMLQR